MKITRPNLRWIFSSLLATCAPLTLHAAEVTSLHFPGKDGPGKGKHIVFLTGDEEYRSEESAPMLAKILSQRHGYDCTVLFALVADGTINPDNQKSLPDSEAIDKADTLILNLRFRQWPDEVMERFEKAWLAGKPIIALRTSTHPFNFPADSRWARYSWNSQAPWKGGFGKEVLGETWVSHWGEHKVEAALSVIEASAKEDPLLNGVGEIFALSDVYEAYPPADAKILMRGKVLSGMKPDSAPLETRKPRSTDKVEQPVNDPMMPLTWTRNYKNEAGNTNRILLTTLGASTDFEEESLRRLFVNAVYWSTSLEIPAKADVTYVDEYHPSYFGFKSFRKNLKVSDLDLGKPLPATGTPKP